MGLIPPVRAYRPLTGGCKNGTNIVVSNYNVCCIIKYYNIECKYLKSVSSKRVGESQSYPTPRTKS